MAADKVRIIHPETGAESAVTLAAFERRSSKLGWVLADSHPGEVRFDNPESVDERAALVAEAEALGLKVHHRAKSETIRRQIDRAKAEAYL